MVARPAGPADCFSRLEAQAAAPVPGVARLACARMRRRGKFAGCVVLAVGLLGVLAPAAGAVPPARRGRAPVAAAQGVHRGRRRHRHDHLRRPRPRRAPGASTAKIMTALTAVERLAPDALIPVSPRTAAVEPNKIGMKAGEEWPFDQTMASMMMVSANDAAYAMAEAAGGSLERVRRRHERNRPPPRHARQHVLRSGRPRYDRRRTRAGPYVSAYDLAIATRNALTVPVIAKYAALRHVRLHRPGGVAHHLTNHNRFLPENGYDYAGAIGFKTGFTNRAEHTFVGTATRNGRTLIVVILNTYDAYGWAASLLDAGFATPPDTPGIGETIPAVRLARTRRAPPICRASPPSRAASRPPTTATMPRRPRAHRSLREQHRSAAPPRAARRTAHRTMAAAPPSSRSRNIVIVVLVLLVALVMLRRRAVKRRRARGWRDAGSAPPRCAAAGFPVVDGRYRTGTRLGPPVESHVRRPARRDRPSARHGTALNRCATRASRRRRWGVRSGR